MALYQPTHNVGPGHGTRMGFRIASLLGIALSIAFLAYFIWGPRQAVTENPPAAENTQVEKQAAPQPAAPPAAPQPAAPQAVTPQAPATTQPPATQDAQSPATQPQPAAP